MDDFDLYSAPAPVPATAKPTTLAAMAAADWTGPDMEGRWHLMWDDHTDYGNEPGGGLFICRLYEERGRWVYDLGHSERAGGGDFDLGLSVDDFAVEDVLVACKVGALARAIERWEQGTEEYVSRRAADEEEAA